MNSTPITCQEAPEGCSLTSVRVIPSYPEHLVAGKSIFPGKRKGNKLGEVISRDYNTLGFLLRDV